MLVDYTSRQEKYIENYIYFNNLFDRLGNYSIQRLVMYSLYNDKTDSDAIEHF